MKLVAHFIATALAAPQSLLAISDSVGTISHQVTRSGANRINARTQPWPLSGKLGGALAGVGQLARRGSVFQKFRRRSAGAGPCCGKRSRPSC